MVGQKVLKYLDAVFLVTPGTSSFPTRNDTY
jgi:hypothetical protein